MDQNAFTFSLTNGQILLMNMIMTMVVMKVRLLLIVREPVTRLVSDFTQISHNRREKGLASRFIRIMIMMVIIIIVVT